mmetsp:Transcript_11022/g.28665  ORF Transcript_11022/g.28665 Transcript_11022/m.28665 type:complete len:403 (+) Transcript_11022:1009-2217(+)
MSADHTTYLTAGAVSSPTDLRCCTSKSVMRSSARSSSVPVAAGKSMSVVGCGGAHFFVTSFWKFLMTIWRFLSRTAKRWRATNTPELPSPRLHSPASAAPPAPPPERASRGTWYSSYVPPSVSVHTSSIDSASLKCIERTTEDALWPPELADERRIDSSAASLPLAYSYERSVRSLMKSSELPRGTYGGRSRSSLNTIRPASWPAPSRFCVGWTARIQKRSCSRRKVCMPWRLDMSHTLIDLSSEFETISSCFGWNTAHDTLLMCPRSVSTSHALVSFIRHNLTCRSSAPDTMSGSVGWNAAQLTPRSWPSSTYLTVASFPPKRSSTCGSLEPSFPAACSADAADAPPLPSSPPIRSLGGLAAPPGLASFLRRPLVSQTRTVWSSEAERTRSSFGWNCAHIT